MTVVEKEWTFPAGERGVRVKTDTFTESCTVDLHFKGSDSLIDMLLTVDALRRQYGKHLKISLNTPYFPYARQDRRMQEGESHSLRVIADLVNSCGFSEVCVVDPHSDVVEAVVNNLKITPQHEAVMQVLPDIAMNYDYLVAPDAGALKKIYKLSHITGIPVVCATKVRDPSTGDISGVFISEGEYETLRGKRILIVDDICDGGGTFITLSAALPAECKRDLYITHGIFSKGKEQLLVDYRNIFCYNDMSK